ncbi:uncharacterized protein K444DRAFT_405582 [Hyaloscypha bicolor E]|uniref:Mid2 domain-containing protein n=1 Tax=Hyaloscypha bicolor E TaxID=1095630 RepID=A0A2J6T934_9HELO|nr:uncharacterized protein K444DRAFT_405582 [Hyaloscypha bicolor E]PMD59532.1 hypothetical protein K444DRAFT_405582 [Hyaloscypha bicolor E]
MTTCIPHASLSSGTSTASNPNAITCSDPASPICNTYIFAAYSSLTMALCEAISVVGSNTFTFPDTFSLTSPSTSTSTPTPTLKPAQTSHISAGAIAGIAIAAAVVGGALVFAFFYFFLRAHRSRSAPPQDLARAAPQNAKPHGAELPTDHVGE